LFDWGFVLAEEVLTKQVFYHLRHICSPFCFGYFGDELFAQAGSYLDSPNLSLPRS
jgi:hypothetical protein